MIGKQYQIKLDPIIDNNSNNRIPGGVPTSHKDTYIRGLKPDFSLQPEFDFSGIYELTAFILIFSDIRISLIFYPITTTNFNINITFRYQFN